MAVRKAKGLSLDQSSAVTLKKDASICLDPILLKLPTEILCNIMSYLTAYEKLSVRITCKRLYSVLSDPIVWSTLIWRDCRKGEKELKALRLALKLSRSSVRSIVISYPKFGRPPAISKFIPQVHYCKCVRYLTLMGVNLTLKALEGLLSALPSLYSLSLTTGNKISCGAVLKAAARAETLQILTFLKPYVSLSLVLRAWQECGYLPSDLRIKEPYSSLMTLRSLSLKSDHPATFSFHPICSAIVGCTFCMYPLFEFSLCPSRIVSCHNESLCPRNSALVLCKSRTDSDQYVSASYLGSDISGWNLGSDTMCTVPFLSASIQSLRLAGLEMLTSTQLTVISESCPNLVCLDISKCENSLIKLEGLADVSSNCLQLTSVNLMRITKVEGVEILWEILAGMKRLRHLAVFDVLLVPDRYSSESSTLEVRGQRVSHLRPFNEQSLVRIRRSVAQMNLVAFEIDCDHYYTPSSEPPLLDLYLPAFRFLKHLRMKKKWLPYSGTIDFSQFLRCVPHLTYLYVSINAEFNHVSLPADPTCYQSLRQLFFQCPQCHISEEVIEALVHHRSLTNVYLCSQVAVSSLRNLIESSPQLCEFKCCVIKGKAVIASRMQQELETILTSRGVVWSLDCKSKSIAVRDMSLFCEEGCSLDSLWNV